MRTAREAARDKVFDERAAALLLHGDDAGLELGDGGHVARHHAELAVAARQDDHLDWRVLIERLGRHGKVEEQAAGGRGGRRSPSAKRAAVVRRAAARGASERAGTAGLRAARAAPRRSMTSALSSQDRSLVAGSMVPRSPTLILLALLSSTSAFHVSSRCHLHPTRHPPPPRSSTASGHGTPSSSLTTARLAN